MTFHKPHIETFIRRKQQTKGQREEELRQQNLDISSPQSNKESLS